MPDMTMTETRVDEALPKLRDRRRQLNDWLHLEETSREGAHEWKAEVLRGRLQEVEWAIELLES